MAAALQSCHLVMSPAPAPLAASSARVTRPPSMLVALAVPPALGSRQRSLPSLMKLRRHHAAAASRPCLVVRAHNCGGVHAQPPPDESAAHRHFIEERKHVMDSYNDIVHNDDSCVYTETTRMSGQLCLSANQALNMASQVMSSACLNLGAPNEVSPDTVQRTLRAYVKVFLQAADDRIVSKTTAMSFTGALRGLASIGHILLESALEALGHAHPRASLSEYAFNYDVKAMRRELDRQMDAIEDGIRKARASAGEEEMCVVMPGILEATRMAGSLVRLMVARRVKALGKAKVAAV